MAEIELQVDLGNMLEALAVAGPEFVLIGGWALAVHGYGRGTDDLDILVRPPNLIEILTKISGVTFDDAWADKITIEIRGHEVSVLGRRSLLANKRAAGRAKDLADVEWLERTTGEKGSS